MITVSVEEKYIEPGTGVFRCDIVARKGDIELERSDFQALPEVMHSNLALQGAITSAKGRLREKWEALEALDFDSLG